MCLLEVNQSVVLDGVWHGRGDLQVLLLTCGRAAALARANMAAERNA